MSEWIKAHLSKTTYSYSFSTFTKLCYLIYGYNTIIPIGMWGLLLYYKCKLKLNEYFCLYGYAMSIWVLVAIINISVFEIFNLKFLSIIIRWISTIIGFKISSLFLFKELNLAMNHIEPNTKKLILLLLFLCHAILSITFKILFFT
ncbi:hypothetical protein PMAC_001793 [Pneumocystis sp. 'macacae']|nr:hypothetical protein PMAC_001793 [Pneumocystis sp. 'macacae']